MTLRQLGQSPHQGLAKGSLLLQESRDRNFKSNQKLVREYAYAFENLSSPAADLDTGRAPLYVPEFAFPG
jgi:hypothetical protein